MPLWPQSGFPWSGGSNEPTHLTEKSGPCGRTAAFEKPSRPPANGQELGRPPRASTLIARVLTATECGRVAPPHLLHPPPPGTASAGPLLSLLPGAPEPGVSPQ